MNFKQAYEEAQKSGEIESLTPKFKENWKKGEIMVGQFVARNELISKINQQVYFMYTFQTDEGPMRTILGAGVDKGEGPMLKEGELYALKYEGLEKIGGGQQMHRFQVMRIPRRKGVVVEAGDEIPI